MKRIYVKEEWCLGCHLCEYNCAFANSGKPDMTEALKGKPIFPRIHIEEGEKICYAVSCRWSYVKKKYKLNVTNFPFFCNC